MIAFFCSFQALLGQQKDQMSTGMTIKFNEFPRFLAYCHNDAIYTHGKLADVTHTHTVCTVHIYSWKTFHKTH